MLKFETIFAEHCLYFHDSFLKTQAIPSMNGSDSCHLTRVLQVTVN